MHLSKESSSFRESIRFFRRKKRKIKIQFQLLPFSPLIKSIFSDTVTCLPQLSTSHSLKKHVLFRTPEKILNFPCDFTQILVFLSVTFYHFYMINGIFLTYLWLLLHVSAQHSWTNYHLCEFNGFIVLRHGWQVTRAVPSNFVNLIFDSFSLINFPYVLKFEFSIITFFPTH